MNVVKLGVPGVALCVAFHVTAGCATQRLAFQMQAPAEVNLKTKGVQSLAVSDFDGPDEAGKKVAEVFTAKLVESQFFKVVERDKLLALEKEQALGMVGIVDDKMAAKAGKILGVDAIVVGKVTSYSVKDEPYTKTVMKSRATGTYRTECNKKGDCSQVENFEQVPVVEQHHVRNGTIAVSYRVVKAESGEVLVGKQGTANYRYDTGNAQSGRERGIEEVLPVLTKEVVDKLSTEIVPHAVSVERDFENGGWLFGDAEVKHGIELVKANRWADAIERWEAVIKRDPQNNAAYYNLGIAYELTGNFQKAEEAYRAAEKIDPKPLYIQAVSHVKQSADKARKLKEQQN